MLRMVGAAPHGLALQEIADSLGLAKSTVHGILATLRHVGMIEQDRRTGRYRLPGGPASPRLTGEIDPHLLRSYAMNWTDSLAAHAGEAVLIGVLADTVVEVEVVHHVFSPDGTRQRLVFGKRFPAHATALGKVLLAFAGWRVPREGGHRLSRYTSRTVVDPEQLHREWLDVRARGHAVAVGELQPDIASVAAPVRAPGGICVGAVAAVGPLDRVCPDGRRPRADLVEQVVATGHAVSGQLEREA